MYSLLCSVLSLLLLLSTPQLIISITLKDNGVMFKKLGKVNFVTSCHNLVITYDVQTNFINPIDTLITTIKESKTIVENDSDYYYLKDDYVYQVNTVIDKLDNIKTIFQKFVRAFPDTPYHTIPSETTDGFVSSPTKGEIANIIETINNNNTTTTTASQFEGKMINRLISNIEINYENMTNIKNAIERANITHLAIYNHYKNNKSQMRNVSRDVVLSTSLSMFDSSLRDVKEDFEEFNYQIDSTVITRKTSVFIISPNTLLNIMHKLQHFQISLLYPALEQYIPEYYTISRTIIERRDNVFYFIIRIPIKSTYEYDIYKLYYFWIPISNVENWSRKIHFHDQEIKYLAINEHQHYITLNNLQSCIYKMISQLICVASKHFQKRNDGNGKINEDNCILSIYNDESKEIQNKNCLFKYEFNRNTEFIKIDKDWIGSVKKSENVKKICSNNINDNISIHKGIVRIPISNNCKYIGSTFMLPYFQWLIPNKDINISQISHPITLKNVASHLIPFFTKNKESKYLIAHDINNIKYMMENEYANKISTPKLNLGFIVALGVIFFSTNIFYVLYINHSICEKKKKKKKNDDDNNLSVTHQQHYQEEEEQQQQQQPHRHHHHHHHHHTNNNTCSSSSSSSSSTIYINHENLSPSPPIIFPPLPPLPIQSSPPSPPVSSPTVPIYEVIKTPCTTNIINNTTTTTYSTYTTMIQSPISSPSPLSSSSLSPPPPPPPIYLNDYYKTPKSPPQPRKDALYLAMK